MVKCVKNCVKFKDRLIGNMFHKNITDMCFPKCNSIHTFFMFKPIDVYMTDKNNKILYIYKSLKPYRIIWPKKNIYYTYETSIDKYNFKINDIFKERKN